ncbi:hypothetical protein GmHk_08G023038 [Glycine max]|nr:hypothetical protein GmHk_08G023038 [Glycine max]
MLLLGLWVCWCLVLVAPIQPSSSFSQWILVSTPGPGGGGLREAWTVQRAVLLKNKNLGFPYNTTWIRGAAAKAMGEQNGNITIPFISHSSTISHCLISFVVYLHSSIFCGSAFKLPCHLPIFQTRNSQLVYTL